MSSESQYWRQFRCDNTGRLNIESFDGRRGQANGNDFLSCLLHDESPPRRHAFHPPLRCLSRLLVGLPPDSNRIRMRSGTSSAKSSRPINPI